LMEFLKNLLNKFTIGSIVGNNWLKWFTGIIHRNAQSQGI
jgi:hypothetical protein